MPKVSLPIFHHQRELYRGEGLRTIVAGTREGEHAGVTYGFMLRALLSLDWQISCVLSGANRGHRRKVKRGGRWVWEFKWYSTDQLGEIVAARHGIPLEQYPANWDLGKRGGPVRNAQMIGLADALVAFPGNGPGTRGIIEMARREQKQRPFKLAVFDAPGGFVDDGESAIDPVTHAMLVHGEI